MLRAVETTGADSGVDVAAEAAAGCSAVSAVGKLSGHVWAPPPFSAAEFPDIEML
ncbi:Uncharacterised protein [Chlamydia trachomatis]|nr:Uncharacterised protein [Chlamydia trachomatis]